MNYIVAHLLFLFLKFCARKIYFFCHFLFNKILILRRIKSAVQGEVTERPPGSLQIKSRTSFSGITNRHRCGGRRSKVTANRETDELNIFCSWNHTSRSVGNLHRRRVPPSPPISPPPSPSVIRPPRGSALQGARRHRTKRTIHSSKTSQNSYWLSEEVLQRGGAFRVQTCDAAAGNFTPARGLTRLTTQRYSCEVAAPNKQQRGRRRPCWGRKKVFINFVS